MFPQTPHIESVAVLEVPPGGKITPAERPPTPDDPRPAAFRQIPPFGGA